MIGSIVTVTVDRKLGSVHPKHSSLIYPVNYGYVEGIIGGDGAFQDAYILGVPEPVESFTGEVIAVIHRKNDVEDKWIVAPKGVYYSKAEILHHIFFQEQFFEIEVIEKESSL